MDFMHTLATVLTGFGYIIINFFGHGTVPALPALTHGESSATTSAQVQPSTETSSSVSSPDSAMGPHAYSETELTALAGNDFASGNLPIGDYHYVSTTPKRGYVYFCKVPSGEGKGAMVDGPWIRGSSWNYLEKTHVAGAVHWPTATFSTTVSGAVRALVGNDLPVGQTTGIFPIPAGDKEAYQYDRNPNKIAPQALSFTLPAHPTYSATPYCMGMEVGIMTNGVALFNGFDADLRDAAAHEIQDSNNGHPQGNDEYHYHSLPAWAHGATVSTVIGFAYDGFPITGPVVSKGKYLTTDDLDECHGLTSTVTLDGKSVTTYHYVMTYDFPYSASCFRGKPVTTGPSVSPTGTKGQSAPASQQQTQSSQNMTPPQQALAACAGSSSGASCSFTGGRGETVTGTCQTPPGSTLACVPAR